LHGGVLMNPLEALSRIIASLRYKDGKIAVESFYDDVIDPTLKERAEIARVPFDEAAYQESLGIKEFFGEPGFSTRERNWLRPTLDVNGIWGGYQGQGSKTVIPSSAHAKITCRLVANQNPNDIAKKLEQHIQKYCPPGIRIEMRSDGSADPASISANHPGNQIVKEVLTTLYGTEPYYTRLGGTIPVGAFFKKSLGVDMIGFGWSLASENLHAPNEYFLLESFYRGQRGYCMLLERLGK
jgi:acetylornithine deacetylase/succinyl-diaminopimelate desuccinylase-like protein